MWTRRASAVALLALGVLMASAGSEPVRVRVEFIVEDARRRPVADLNANEVVVHQGGDRERIESFERRPAPGHYALTYVDLSLELSRDGAFVGRGPVKLGAAEAGQPIAYLGSFRLQTFAVGAYDVKLFVRRDLGDRGLSGRGGARSARRFPGEARRRQIGCRLSEGPRCVMLSWTAAVKD